MKQTLLLLIGLALVATACGGEGEDEVSAAPTIVVERADSSGPAEESGDGDGAERETADGDGAEMETSEETVEAEIDASMSADATDEELALAFASCMRDEGIDFPDPTVAADGSVSLIPPGGAANLNFNPNDPAVRAAGEVCSPLLEGASCLPTGDGNLTEVRDNLLAFAECLREQGVDVDDPTFGNGFTAEAIFGGSFDPEDPANADAIAECQGVFGAGGPLGSGE